MFFVFLDIFNCFFLFEEFFFLFSVFFLFFFILGRFVFYDYLFFFNVNNSYLNLFFKMILHYIVNFFFFFFFFSFFISDKVFFSFYFSYFNDLFSVFFKSLIVFFCLIIFIFSFFYFKDESIFRFFEYYIILLFSILGILFLISSNDFFTFYLTVEMQSLCFYVLAAFKHYSILSLEAGLKYFILGSFSSGLLILGNSFVYGLCGFTNFIDLYIFFQFFFFYDSFFFFFFFGFFLLLTSLFFKITAAPFHIWSPDVYQGAPTIVTFFFSIIPKLGFFCFFFRFFYLFCEGFDFSFFFSFVCIFSLFLGSLVSFFQIKIKRLLAYSGIANIGFALLGFFFGFIQAFLSCVLFFFSYILIISVIFFVMLNCRFFQNFLKFKSLYNFFGLVFINQLLVFFVLVNFFSLIGIPPLLGFFGKFYLLLVSINSEFFIFSYFIIVISLISCLVYLNFIRFLMFNKTELRIFFFFLFSRTFCLFLFFFSFFNIYFFFDLDFLLKMIYNLVFNVFSIRFLFFF